MNESMRASGVWRALTITVIMLMGNGLVYAQNALLGMSGFVQNGVEFLRLDFAQEVQQAPRGFVSRTNHHRIGGPSARKSWSRHRFLWRAIGPVS